MTKLEQVARAAYEAECRWADPTERSVPFDEIGVGWKDRQMAGIRAAVEALREPTDKICSSGGAVWDDDLCSDTNALNMWRAMNDAILSEKPDA
jgi:hypothetical protein